MPQIKITLKQEEKASLERLLPHTAYPTVSQLLKGLLMEEERQMSLTLKQHREEATLIMAKLFDQVTPEVRELLRKLQRLL